MFSNAFHFTHLLPWLTWSSKIWPLAILFILVIYFLPLSPSHLLWSCHIMLIVNFWMCLLFYFLFLFFFLEHYAPSYPYPHGTLLHLIQDSALASLYQKGFHDHATKNSTLFSVFFFCFMYIYVSYHHLTFIFVYLLSTSPT